MSEQQRRQYSERLVTAVQAEIDAERAAALGRAGRRVEEAFGRCRMLIGVLDGADDDAALDVAADDARDLTAYRAARAEFDQAMYAYLVQREAIGMLDHRAIRHAFPRPPRR